MYDLCLSALVFSMQCYRFIVYIEVYAELVCLLFFDDLKNPIIILHSLFNSVCIEMYWEVLAI